MIQKFASLTTASLLLFAAGLGCEKAEEKPAEKQAMATGATSADETQTSTGGSNHKGRYDVRSPKEPVAVNKKAKVELAITPADGLKINKEFPWSFEFGETPGVQLAQKSIAEGQIDLGEQEATFPVMLEASAAGAHTLEATGNFSVCNDTKCYVIREEKVSFQVTAEGDQPQGAEEGAAEQAAPAGGEETAGEEAGE